jgi:SAM-dependent methyltransferase
LRSGMTPERNRPVYASLDVAALPDRYSVPWRAKFDEHVADALRPGSRVLDIGSGRNPTIPVERRPTGCTYVGLDLSADELLRAGPGAYDEHVEADASARLSEFDGVFDLVVSWQVLEHVRDLGSTLENIRGYLRQGGVFVTMFSGSWSAFGVVNRLLPNKVAHAVVGRTMGRANSHIPVFPAYYDRCYASALQPLMRPWSTAAISPLYAGAAYFSFSTFATRLYLRYEDFICARGIANLATHYLVVAER